MPKEIDLPDGSVGVFPDEMPDSEIEEVLRKQFPPSAGLRFAAGLKSTTVDPLVAMATPPDLTSGRGMVEMALGPGGRLITHMFDKARDAVKAGKEGKWDEAVESGMDAIPVIGQLRETVRTVSDPLREGNVAGAAGALTGLAATAMLPAAGRGTAAAGRRMAAGVRSAASAPLVRSGLRKLPGVGALVDTYEGIRDIRAGLRRTAPKPTASAAESVPATTTPPANATTTPPANSPSQPPPPPFSGNPAETPPTVSRGTAPKSEPTRSNAKQPEPAISQKTTPTEKITQPTEPAQVTADYIPDEPVTSVASAPQLDLETQLRESIANVLKKNGVAEAFDQPAMKEAMAAKVVKAKAISEGMEGGARTLKAEQYGALLKGRGISAAHVARLPANSPFWATAAEELRNSLVNSGQLTWEQAERMAFKPPSARTVAQIVKMLDQ